MSSWTGDGLDPPLTTDRGLAGAHQSVGAAGLGSLPQLHGEGETDEGVLTLGGVGWRGD
jgi:hypothetical protein